MFGVGIWIVLFVSLFLSLGKVLEIVFVVFVDVIIMLSVVV